MKNLFQAIKKAAVENKACYLAALIESEGSTPRSGGAYMLVDAGGLVYGTIGGGAMEYAAVKQAQQRLQSGQAESFEQAYDLSPAAGMACGGSCRVKFCYLAAGESTLRLADTVLRAASGDRPWWLLLPLGKGSLRIINALPLDGRRGKITLDGGDYYAEQYGYDGLVYVFGAGHVARELVPLLGRLGFGCVVLDDRAEFADPEVFPMAERVQKVSFDALAQACDVQARDYAVVMTRGHVYDAQCERYLLNTPACYIGIMGSKNKARLAREALLAEGYTEAQLARIVTPIGLDIGSETPAEIAVSIAAQLIQVRAAKGK
ncbi:MAG: XdhC family protein [Phascolarctobacterium sp.]|uniref:XdhC family protein n=1 Tax=Phascolarctobacterium sp. TaxID=2049039 RepID=UPI0026DBA984|nr:XdhC family protein [Phascolarctobacterium sp.]MDO4921539.1 XdhC family protein [Phascolarctobacterium sp.]